MSSVNPTNRKRFTGSSLIASLVILSLFLSLSFSTVFALEPEYTIYNSFGAYKFSSHKELGPRQTMTYTVLLYNSGSEAVIVDVVDQLPALLSFVAGTADDSGGVYNSQDHTLSWNDVEVSAISQVLLTFDVTQASVVIEPTEVVNEAVITTDSGIIETDFSTILTPDSPMDDVEYPVVNSVIIDEVDALTEREVTLYIDAADNVGVESMFIKEYQLVEKPNSAKQWEATESDTWVPFQEEYTWTLGETPGVHFVGVWVADAAGNISFATQESFDFASYLEPVTTIENKITNIPYAAYYDQGVEVTTILDQLSGPEGLCLYIWYAGNFGDADQVSCADAEVIEFMTPSAGIYIFVAGILAPEEVSYNISITPGGGPTAWIEASASKVAKSLIDNAVSSFSTLFGELGLDPISLAINDQPTGAPIFPNYPASAYRFHLPIVWR
jgi:uncharacterized repeat protein (TIGR01451 family)